jgi:uncharacterized protein YggE
MMLRRSVMPALISVIASASSLTAQDVPTSGPRAPEILTVGEGLRSVPADRASVIISVETHARTPSEAGALNATMNNAIRAAVAALGVPREDIATYGYMVQHAMRREPPYGRDTQFVATNAVRVTLRRPEQLAILGRVIDTALTAGATHIAGVRYEARRTSDAEREALADAMADARSRAEAVARAAGGSLGELLQATTQFTPSIAIPTSGGDLGAQMRRAAARAAAEPTSVTAGEIEVRQYVTARWRFVPSGR